MADQWVVSPDNAVVHSREAQLSSTGATVDSAELFLASTPGQHQVPGGVMADRHGTVQVRLGKDDRAIRVITGVSLVPGRPCTLSPAAMNQSVTITAGGELVVYAAFGARVVAGSWTESSRMPVIQAEYMVAPRQIDRLLEVTSAPADREEIAVLRRRLQQDQPPAGQLEDHQRDDRAEHGTSADDMQESDREVLVEGHVSMDERRDQQVSQPPCGVQPTIGLVAADVITNYKRAPEDGSGEKRRRGSGGEPVRVSAAQPSSCSPDVEEIRVSSRTSHPPLRAGGRRAFTPSSQAIVRSSLPSRLDDQVAGPSGLQSVEHRPEPLSSRVPPSTARMRSGGLGSQSQSAAVTTMCDRTRYPEVFFSPGQLATQVVAIHQPRPEIAENAEGEPEDFDELAEEIEQELPGLAGYSGLFDAHLRSGHAPGYSLALPRSSQFGLTVRGQGPHTTDCGICDGLPLPRVINTERVELAVSVGQVINASMLEDDTGSLRVALYSDEVTGYIFHRQATGPEDFVAGLADFIGVLRGVAGQLPRRLQLRSTIYTERTVVLREFMAANDFIMADRRLAKGVIPVRENTWPRCDWSPGFGERSAGEAEDDDSIGNVQPNHGGPICGART